MNSFHDSFDIFDIFIETNLRGIEKSCHVTERVVRFRMCVCKNGNVNRVINLEETV